MEDDTVQIVPVSGTRNASRNTAKYFDHVVYMRVKGGKHNAGSATTYLNKILTGSRLNVTVEAAADIDLRPFFSAEMRQAAMSVARQDTKKSLQGSKAALSSGIAKPPSVIGGIRK